MTLDHLPARQPSAHRIVASPAGANRRSRLAAWPSPAPRLGRLAAALALALASPLALANAHTWTGNGPNEFWSTSNIIGGVTPNWVNPFVQGIAPVNGDSLIFAGSKQTVNVNDYVKLSVLGISFAQGAAAFSLGGNGLTVDAQGITNHSSQVQTFNMPVTAGPLASTWDGGVAGMSFNGGAGLLNTNLTLSNKVTVNLASADVFFGTAGSASLTLKSGSHLQSDQGVVGYHTGSSSVVTITGSGSTWGNSRSLNIAAEGDGALNISNGGSVTSEKGFVGAGTNTRGAVTVTGAGSSWANSQELGIGVGARGTLNISDGGRVSAANGWIGSYQTGYGNGAVTVTGAGSIFDIGAALTIAYLGRGTLDITNGGRVTNVRGTVGTTYNATGSVTVNGTGSSWANSDALTVASDGTGSLNITNGGRVSSASGRLGERAGSSGSVTVSGADSAWANSNDLTVGEQGTGTLWVLNGGTVSSVGGMLGSRSGSLGRATVSGAGSTWVNAGDLAVGRSGAGILNILDSGSVTAQALTVGASGTLNLDGGSLTLASAVTPVGVFNWVKGALGLTGAAGASLGAGLLNSSLTLASGKTLSVTHTLSVNSGSTLTLSGGQLQAGVLSVGQGGTLIVSGNSNTLFDNTVDVAAGAEFRVVQGSAATFLGLVQHRTGATFSGTGDKLYAGGLSVGASPGLGLDAGNVSFGDSNIYLAEIGGTAACTAACGADDNLKNSSFDKYMVGGKLSLGGTLKLVSWNGFVAQAGQHFDLLDWGSTAGNFANIDATGLTLAAGTRLDYDQLYTDGSIGVTAVPEPGTYAMLLAGLGWLGVAGRRRASAA